MAVAAKAKPVAAQRTVTRAAPVAEVQRVGRPVVVPTDRVVALGRDGKPIWRKSQDSIDKYAVPEGAEPDGWKYEWKRKSVFGREDVQHQVTLKRNGWTDVPANRHDGMWMPAGYPGSIEIDGMVLMEIPLELWKEAKREDKRNADSQVRDSRKAAGMLHNAEIENPDNKHLRNPIKVETVAIQNQNKYDYTLDE